MRILKNLPEIILVNTQLPENLGAVARSMLNFNLKKLILVSPDFDLRHEKIKPVSAGADIVINESKVYQSFDKAIENFNIIIATTNRIRSIQKKAISFNHLKSFLDNKKNKIGIVFGPERSGLDNDKIALCDYVLKIDTNRKFSSLNLSLSCGGSFFTVILGQISEYFLFTSNHLSFPSSVSGTIASNGHSGSQTPQSIHSSGLITSIFFPS